MISYDSMVTEVTARLGNRQDIASRIGRWINYAMFELLLNPRFSFFELDRGPVFANTIANTGTYALTTWANDIWFLLDVRDNTNNRRVRRVHYTEIDKVTQTTGFPTRYYRFGTSISFDPIPLAAYQVQLRYRTRPADFISGSNMILGTEWEEPILVLATLKGAQALRDTGLAAEQRTMLEQLLGTHMDVPTLEDADAEPTMQPTLIFPSF